MQTEHELIRMNEKRVARTFDIHDQGLRFSTVLLDFSPINTINRHKVIFSSSAKVKTFCVLFFKNQLFNKIIFLVLHLLPQNVFTPSSDSKFWYIIAPVSSTIATPCATQQCDMSAQYGKDVAAQKSSNHL